MAEAGPKQHFLPAAFIGRFSEAQTGASRKRQVWVVRRGEQRPHKSAARRVGFALDLYTLIDPSELDATLIDQMWSTVEATLPEALDDLVAGRDGKMAARPWAQTLVPFFASLFVRGPEFTRRFETRLRDALGDSYEEAVRNPDNTNFARLIELQRLYAVVMRAEWRVVHFAEDARLITSDVGYSLTRDLDDDRIGYAIPIDEHTAAALFPGSGRPRLWWRDGSWIAGPITHIDMPAAAGADLNRATAASGIAELYGPTPESLADARDLIATEDAAAVGPLYLTADGASLRDSEMLWFELLTRLDAPPDPEFLAEEGDFVGAATVAEQDGDLRQAARLLERNVLAATHAAGADHLVTRVAKRDLARLRSRQGDLDAARALQQEILDSAARVDGEHSRQAIEARLNLGITLRNSGNLQEAREQQLAALNAATDRFGERDPVSAHAAWGLFLTLYELGDASGRELMPRFMWVRDADPATLGPSELGLQRELKRVFADRVTSS